MIRIYRFRWHNRTSPWPGYPAPTPSATSAVAFAWLGCPDQVRARGICDAMDRMISRLASHSDPKLIGMLSLGRVEVLRIHRVEQSIVRDLQTAPSTRVASRHTLDRVSRASGLPARAMRMSSPASARSNSEESLAFASAMLTWTAMGRSPVMSADGLCGRDGQAGWSIQDRDLNTPRRACCGPSW
jgi:hypothetical protein